MANEPAFYAQIDGKWHEMAGDDTTVCGKPVPFGVTWTRDVPDEVHCGPNKTKPATVEPVKAKAK